MSYTITRRSIINEARSPVHRPLDLDDAIALVTRGRYDKRHYFLRCDSEALYTSRQA